VVLNNKRRKKDQTRKKNKRKKNRRDKKKIKLDNWKIIKIKIEKRTKKIKNKISNYEILYYIKKIKISE
jgi:hypothetical protein